MTDIARAKVSVIQDHAYVSNVFVVEEQRGVGVGSDLMNKICEWADTYGLPLKLHCRDELIGWYEQFGFVTTGCGDVFGFDGGHNNELLRGKHERSTGS